MPPSPKKKATSITGTFVDVFPVAFDLGFDLGATALSPSGPGSSTYVEDALNLDKNWKNVDDVLKALLQEQRMLLLKDPRALSASSTTRAAKALQALGEASGRKLETDLKKTPEFQQLQRQADRLKKAWDEAPTGWLYDTEKGRIILIGAIAVTGGTVAMYKFRAGDLPASKLASVLSSQLKKKARVHFGGVFEAGVTGVELKPSKGAVVLSSESVFRYEQLRSKTELNIRHVIGHGTSASVGNETVVDLGSVTIKGTASVRGAEDLDVGLHVRPKLDGVELDFGVSHSVGPRPNMGTVQETKIGASLKLAF